MTKFKRTISSATRPLLRQGPVWNAKEIGIILLIFAVGVCWFSLFTGTVSLFDWDEINFAEAAREMLLTGNYRQVQINFAAFWEKPPLFFWLQSFSMSVWGVGAFGARLPNAVVGGLTLAVIYAIGRYLDYIDNNNSEQSTNIYTPNRFAIGWVLLYAGSWLPHLYFKSGIIDPLFNLFIFIGIWFGVLCYNAFQDNDAVKKQAYKYVFLSGIFIGLALLTKGPVALLLASLSVIFYFLLNIYIAKKEQIENKGILPLNLRRPGLFFSIWILTAIIISGLWLAVDLYENGFRFLQEFINYQVRLFFTPDSGHKQPIFYHFIVVLLGCFPMSILALPAFLPKPKNDISDALDFRRVMLCLFWVVMIVFSLVKTKIVHYSSLSYLPLSYLAAWTLWKRYPNNIGSTEAMPATTQDAGVLQVILPRRIWVVFGAVGLLWVVLLTGLPLAAYYKTALYPFIKDKFALACLQTDVVWGGWEWLPGVGYGFGVLFGAWLWQRGQRLQGIRAICWAGIISVPLYLWVVVPYIEQYTQKPAIDFYRQLVGRDAYILPVGFKSYAHLFYGQIQPQNAVPSYQEALSGSLKKPVYFVTKINKTKGLDTLANVRKLGPVGGFCFFVLDKAGQ